MKNWLILIFVLLLVVSLLTLIFWGIGAFAIWVLNIDYNWTIYHGLLCVLIFWILCEIF